ncbi:MAG: hypothetical protein PX482_14455, partial [Microcystis sp. M53602_WE12]|nr:hypothetical protein [Microcystis sp. M53602_WE12]
SPHFLTSPHPLSSQESGDYFYLFSPHPTPYTLHPTPHTLHPTPHTLHPTPHTPHPTSPLPTVQGDYFLENKT